MSGSLLDRLIENSLSETRAAFAYRPDLRRKSWSFRDIAEAAFRFARELEQRGIGRRDRVILWSENCPEWVAAFYGIVLRRAIAVPLDEQSSEDFVAAVCRQTEPKLMLIGKHLDRGSIEYPAMGLNDLTAAISHHSPERYVDQNISEDDIVEIVFTSGTTAEPKGVELSHANILANIEPLEREIRKYARWQFLVEPFRLVSLLPLSHVFGQIMGIFVPQVLRAEVVFQNRFNPSEIIDTVKRERALVLAAVPRVLESLQNKLERDMVSHGKYDEFLRTYDVPGSWLVRWWRFREFHRLFGYKCLSFVTGGASLNPETEEFWARLAFVVVQGYGMTETAALVSINNPFSTRRGSIGQILGTQEVRIGEGDEILVRGGNVSPGYWGGEKQVDGEGWLHTGDIGEIDDTGRLFFKGRKKDVIVTSAGLKIYPGDLEAALTRQPGIADAAVVGIELAGETVPAAALILDGATDPTALVAGANASLAPFQQIRHWAVWHEPDFPRTATQKVRKNLVGKWISERGLTSSGTAEKVASTLSAMISRILGGSGKKVEAEQRLGPDLKLDSLSRIELMSAIEDRYQVNLDERLLTESTSVGDVEAMIKGNVGFEQSTPDFAFPIWPLRSAVKIARAIFYWMVLYPANKILCRARYFGLENLDAVTGPVIFAANHITRADPGIVMAALPGHLRHSLAIAMDGEMLESFRSPPAQTNWFTRLRLWFQYRIVLFAFNAFPLPRASGFRRSFSFVGDAMDRGCNILIFPEGELANEGHLEEFRSGVGLLAIGCEAPIVPVAISGLYELKTQGRRIYAPPGLVSVAFGQIIPFDPLASAAEITAELRARIDSLLEDISKPAEGDE